MMPQAADFREECDAFAERLARVDERDFSRATQPRYIADSQLAVVGDIATRWMAMAQCFAGPPEDPPGSRYMVRSS